MSKIDEATEIFKKKLKMLLVDYTDDKFEIVGMSVQLAKAINEIPCDKCKELEENFEIAKEMGIDYIKEISKLKAENDRLKKDYKVQCCFTCKKFKRGIGTVCLYDDGFCINK